MKKIVEESTGYIKDVLSRNEMRKIIGGVNHDCYDDTDNDFAYCIETDGVLYGVYSAPDGEICIDVGADYCLA